MPLIFDFDRTITKQRTFKTHRIEQAENINQYELGKVVYLLLQQYMLPLKSNPQSMS